MRLDFAGTVDWCQCERFDFGRFLPANIPSQEKTYRFGYRRVPKSWEGEPAPSRDAPMEEDEPNGVFDVPGPARSLGEFLPVEVPDIDCVVGL